MAIYVVTLKGQVIAAFTDEDSALYLVTHIGEGAEYWAVPLSAAYGQ